MRPANRTCTGNCRRVPGRYPRMFRTSPAHRRHHRKSGREQDWVFLRQTIARTPGFSWLFVGPTSMPLCDAQQKAARAAVMAMGNRVRFLGARPYGDLQSYARSFDVALLPYRLSEPTFSGSSTRFYEHLAACRPIWLCVDSRNCSRKSRCSNWSIVRRARQLLGHVCRRRVSATDSKNNAGVRASRGRGSSASKHYGTRSRH